VARKAPTDDKYEPTANFEWPIAETFREFPDTVCSLKCNGVINVLLLLYHRCIVELDVFACQLSQDMYRFFVTTV
jgi:hypothetical protein